MTNMYTATFQFCLVFGEMDISNICYTYGSYINPSSISTCTNFALGRGTTLSLTLEEVKVVCEQEPNCAGLVTWNSENEIRIVSKITKVQPGNGTNCMKYFGKGNHIYTQYGSTIKLLNTQFDSDSQNFGGFQENNFPGYTRPENCSAAPHPVPRQRLHAVLWMC